MKRKSSYINYARLTKICW